MADLRIVDAPLLSTVKGTEKIPTGGEGNFSVSVNQVADFAKLKWILATEGYVENAVGNVQADLNLHKNNVNNPHQVTKGQVGLGNVDNTADLDKPVSNATQSAIITANSGKADKIYVDSQDQLKADKNTVEASLLLKADKVDLTASKITSDGGQTQQDINDFGGARWHAKSGGYDLGATVKLINGDIVKSTVANNSTNPNIDMTGWVILSGSRAYVSVFDYFTVSEKASYLANPTGYSAQIPIQRAINDVNGKDLNFEGLTFALGGSIVVADKSNFILKNGSLKALGTMPSTTGNQVIEYIRCKTFAKHNFKTDGNRQQRTSVETAVHNIQMQDCSGFIFYNVTSDNSICDGLYIGPTSTVTANNVCSQGMLINCNFNNASRNNLSIIVGKQLSFQNCKFIGANGISPEAGVDIETNDYKVADIIRDISFDNCFFGQNFGWQFAVIAFDDPKGIRVNGGTIVSDQARNPVNGTTTGGAHIGGDGTILTGVEFRDFTANSGYCVRVTAVPKSLGKLKNCTFRNIASEGFAQVHSESDGIIVDDCDFYDSISGVISLAGKVNLINNSRFTNTKASIISSGTTPIIEITDNTLRGSTTTGTAIISVNTDNAVITDNKIYDAQTTYYIQAEGVGAVVEGNLCSSNTAQPTKKAIRGNGNKTGRIRFNTFVNLHATDGVELIGTQPFITLVGYNKGGTANVPTKSNTALAIANAFKGAFPTAVGLPNGTQLFCNDILNTATVYADVWYANGKPLDKQDIINSQSVTLPAVNNGLQASVNITVAGVSVGMRTNISFSVTLAGSHIWAEVTAVDTVTIYRQNLTGANLSSLSGTAKLKLEYT